MQGGVLTSAEEALVKDIYTIQQFVEVENPTQLSQFGLEYLERNLAPGSATILFRNDHFSTLYKHPDSHQLFTLVTDAGYASHAEIVWESLVDVNGSRSELLSGDFRPVGQTSSSSAASGGEHPRYSSNATVQVQEAAGIGGRSTPRALSPQEQADADYAYALSLQFQEEERRGSSRNNRQTRDRSASTPLRPEEAEPSSRRAPPNRFSTPGLNALGGGGAWSQPRNEDDEPPPPYEQAPPPRRRPAGVPERAQSPMRRTPVAPGADRRTKDKDCVVM